MASEQVFTMNLSDDGEGMVPINQNQSTNFVKNDAPTFQPEKNVSQNKETMDSTPINDIMMEPPMMTDQPKMQSMQMAAPDPQGAYSNGQAEKPASKNPMNLTDEQMTALLVAACTALAVSKPVQDKLATSIPKFLNEQGGRSMVGLASTGVVAAIVFYFMKDYVIKP